jgi:hypothetical protein
MGGKSSTSQSSVQVPPQVLAQYNAVTSQANALMGTNANGQPNTPFQQYSTNPNAFVAPINQEQTAGINATNQYATAAQPYYGAAAGLTMAGAGPANLGTLNTNQYMSPYMGDVMGSLLASENNQNQIQQSGLQGQEIMAGAFGGDRAGIAAANLANQQNLANNQVNAQALQSGYTQAQNTAAQQQGAQLTAEQANLARLTGAGAQFGSLGTAAQSAGLQGATAQQTAGATQQQTEQAGLTALYNQFEQQQAYPFQTLGELANISEGIGALSGSTTTTTQPSSFFSDERLKEDIEPIGETYDGQKIVKFRYKGHPGKQIGLIAQNVEHHHPEAVGLARGFKTVDYDEATKDAAHRGHFASGGVAGPSYDPNWLTNLLQAHQAMYANMPGASNLYGQNANGQPGKGGPASAFQSSPVSHLMTANPIQQHQQPTAMQDLASTVNAGENVGKAYNGVSAGLGQAQKAITGLGNLATGNTVNGMATGSNLAALDQQAQTNIADNGPMARGGLARAAGGIATPYAPDDDTGGGYMNIAQADQPPGPVKMATANAPAPGPSGMSQVSQGIGTLAGLAGLAMALKRGGVAGRRGYDDGGGVDDGTWDSPDDTASIGSVIPADPTNLGVIRNAPVGASLKNAWNNLTGATPPGVDAGTWDNGQTYPNAIAGTGPGNMPTYDVPDGGYTPDQVNKIGAGSFAPGTIGQGAEQAREKNEKLIGLAQDVSGVIPGNEPVPGVAPKPIVPSDASSKATHEATPPGVAPGRVPPPLPSGGIAPYVSAGMTATSETAPASQTTEKGKGENATLPGQNWMQENQGWLVPILSGIGAMASSPSRYLGSAILQGVGAGAGAYEQTQNQITQRAQEQAHTQEALQRARLTGAEATAYPETAGLKHQQMLQDLSKGTIFHSGDDDYVVTQSGQIMLAGAWKLKPTEHLMGGPQAQQLLRRMGYSDAAPAGLDPEWAAIRHQESHGHQFNEDGTPLVSGAGAVGIGQVMPGTGPEAAQLAGLPWDKNRLYNDPAYNEALGKAYYAKQRSDFGDPDMAAAAYNAGPQAVRDAVAKGQLSGRSWLSYLPAETQDYVPYVRALRAQYATQMPEPPPNPLNGFSPSEATGAAEPPRDAAPGAPSKATTPNDYSYTVPLGHAGQTIAAREASYVAVHPPSNADKTANTAQMQTVQHHALEAQNNRQQLLELTANMVRENGPLATGAGIKDRAEMANFANTCARLLGFGELGISKDVGQEQIAQKLTNAQSAAMARGMGEHAVGALSLLQQGFANSSMTSEAIKQILADSLVASQRDIDRGAYARKYLSTSPLGVGRDMSAAFDADHPVGAYTQDRDTLMKMMTPDRRLWNYSPIQYIIGSHGTEDHRDIQAKFRNPALVEQNYKAPGTYRYFTTRVM